MVGKVGGVGVGVKFEVPSALDLSIDEQGCPRDIAIDVSDQRASRKHKDEEESMPLTSMPENTADHDYNAAGPSNLCPVHSDQPSQPKFPPREKRLDGILTHRNAGALEA